MSRRPPRSTRTCTRVPYTTLFRARRHVASEKANPDPAAGPQPASIERLAIRIPAAPLPLDADNAVRATMHRRSSRTGPRSEEHTSELQSLMRISYAVFCLKKKKYYNITLTNEYTPVQEQNVH